MAGQRDLGNNDYGQIIGGVMAGRLISGRQSRVAAISMTTSDDATTAVPTAWTARYVNVVSDVTFVVAIDVVTGGAAGLVGTVYGAGSYLLPITLTTGGTGKIHVCTVTGTGTAYLSFLGD